MLVTGASSGIGRALAIRAARAGYAVYAVGRDSAALGALRAKIEGESGFIETESIDIAIAANARGIISRTLTRFGSLDVLVNNAGFVSVGPLDGQSDEELQRQFATHVIGPVALVREAREALRAARGHIFMLGSGVARVPIGGLGAYPPAKAALRSATAILRRELAPHGVAVTYVDPGAVDTAFMKRAGMPGAPDRILTSPEAVARKILIAVGTRPRVLNAVAWQTAAVALAELFPRLTDALLERSPTLIGGESPGLGAASPVPTIATDGPALTAPNENLPTPSETDQPLAGGVVASTDALDARSDSAQCSRDVAQASSVEMRFELPPAEAVTAVATPFETALEPHRRRMEKLNLRESFVRDVLVPGATLDLGEMALRWAGMPNKNERAITEEVFEALADAGFLERSADHGYRVLRAP
jgi:short-subunit dehydrogenase